MKAHILSILLISVSLFSAAQVTGPEQDCGNAIPVCQPVYVQLNSYSGVGMIHEINDTNTCLLNGENNSVWYSFQVATGGSLEFLITPMQPDDYDFAVFDVTNYSCADIISGALLPVRCNYAAASGPSIVVTGLQAGASDTVADASGSHLLKPLAVVAGQKFVLVVDNFTSSPGGYTLDFSSSTVLLADPSGASPETVSNIKCNADSVILVSFTSPIECSSIAADGSDFYSTLPAISITGAEGIGCTASGTTRSVLLHYTGQLIDGQVYAIGIQQGTDSNGLNAFCGAVVQSPVSFTASDSLAAITVAAFSYFSTQKTAYFFQQSYNGIEFFWDFGDGSTGAGAGNRHIYSAGGNYNVCLIAKGLCASDTICKQVSIASNEIAGKVFLDVNEDCQFNGGDVPLPHRIIRTQPGLNYAMTDSAGNYSVLTSAGNFDVHQIIAAGSNNRWTINQYCPANLAGHQVSFTGPQQDTAGIDFADTAIICPYLDVHVSSGNRRMCYNSGTTITYCNEGFADALNVRVTVVYPPHIALVHADSSYTQIAVKKYQFNIGTVAAQQCGAIHLTDYITCDTAYIGYTQCIEAFITPLSTCVVTDPRWSGADVQVDAACNAGTATLHIMNAGLGDMTDSSTFIVFLDSLQVLSRKFMLNSYDTLEIQFAPNGQTVRLEAGQAPYHPRNSTVSVTLEACASGTAGIVSLGFSMQFPPYDEDPEYAIGCNQLTNSYDPNDKQAFPTGIFEDHYILPGQKIDYTIRFQNTGNDTAYNVMIWDTLSPHLDLSTLDIGGASHPFDVTLTGEGGVAALAFFFDDIYLPDSTTDYDGSQGYVSFTISSYDTTPVFTRIENNADIYFDLNPPVMTNTVFHTISNTKFISSEELDSVTITYLPGAVGVGEVSRNLKFELYPNPSTGKIILQIDYDGTESVQVEAFDVFGKLLYREQSQFTGQHTELDLSALPKGVYILRLSNSDFTATRKFTLLR